jgi:2-amino-4-hydroxy-6-hydroxymethyldihydropteridine diphosphokinase
VTRVAIALGSNLGDRRAHLQFAISRLRTILTDVRVSSIHETAPEGVDGPQPDYLNAVVAGFTTLSPIALLQTLLAIERERGRTRPSLRASRTLDLDLILYGDAVIDTPELTVPHPRYLERQFVTKPLAEIW